LQKTNPHMRLRQLRGLSLIGSADLVMADGAAAASAKTGA
jgi:hypothetical protein